MSQVQPCWEPGWGVYCLHTNDYLKRSAAWPPGAMLNMKCQILCRGSYLEGTVYIQRAIEVARRLQAEHDVELIAIVPRALERAIRAEEIPARIVRNERNALSYVEIQQPDAVLLDLRKMPGEILAQLQSATPRILALAPEFRQRSKVDWAFSSVVNGGRLSAVIPQGIHRILTSRYEVQAYAPQPQVYVALDGARINDRTLYQLKLALARVDIRATYVLAGLDDSQRFAAFRRQVEGDDQVTVLDHADPARFAALHASAFGLFTRGQHAVEAVYAGLPGIHLFDRERDQFRYAGILNEAVGVQGLFNDMMARGIMQHIQAWLADRDHLVAMHRATHDRVQASGLDQIVAGVEHMVTAATQTSVYRQAA